jgi:hypothetical protein
MVELWNKELEVHSAQAGRVYKVGNMEIARSPLDKEGEALTEGHRVKLRFEDSDYTADLSRCAKLLSQLGQQAQASNNMTTEDPRCVQVPLLDTANEPAGLLLSRTMQFTRDERLGYRVAAVDGVAILR